MTVMSVVKMIIFVILGVITSSVNGNRIAGGEVAQISDYPFSVALVTNGGQGSSYSHVCGGTLLTTNSILSAASCFYTNQEVDPPLWWRARVGSASSNARGTVYLIRSIVPNPGFNPTTLAHDIAVLRTALNIALVPGSIEVARVAGAAYTFTTNQVVTAIGWGAISNQIPSSAELRKVDVFVVNQQTCATRYNEIGVTLTEDMVCAGWLDVGVIGQCQGDTGSPLLDNQAVVAVFSRAQGCAQGWYPAINTRLSPYLNWVVATALA